MPERQTRRHLTAAEAELALGRGKEIEILLGSCGDASRPGVRFANLSRGENSVRLSVFEMVDMKDPNFLDLYETVPLDGFGDSDGRVIERSMSSISECIAFLRESFPEQSHRMVNFGVLGDEYLDYLRQAAQAED